MRLRKLPHGHGQRADMIMMAMRQRNGVHIAPRLPEERQPRASLAFWMHAGVQQDPVFVHLHHPAARPDLCIRISFRNNHQPIKPQPPLPCEAKNVLSTYAIVWEPRIGDHTRLGCSFTRPRRGASDLPRPLSHLQPSTFNFQLSTFNFQPLCHPQPPTPKQSRSVQQCSQASEFPAFRFPLSRFGLIRSDSPATVSRFPLSRFLDLALTAWNRLDLPGFASHFWLLTSGF